MMDLSGFKNLTVGGVELKQMWMNGIQVWKSGYKNQVSCSIDTDGSVYNTTGYKNGYRVRSGGAEGAQNGAACTGFIPVTGGDAVRLSGWDFSVAQNANAINVFDSSFANIGQFTMNPAEYGIFLSYSDPSYNAYSYSSVEEERDGVWKWVVPPAASGVAYIRVTGYSAAGAPGGNMIVTVNEEIGE